jgi:diguanylate cyclase (GGDEF)-like protein
MIREPPRTGVAAPSLRCLALREVKYVESPVGSRGKTAMAELFASYGDLAKRLLPTAARITWYGSDGNHEWSQGDVRVPDRPIPELIDPIMPGGSIEPQALKLSDSLTAVAAPVVLDGKPISILLVRMLGDRTHSERRVLNDVMGAVAPLLDCLCRELSQIGRKALKSATLSERTEELEWLFALTESLHSSSNDPRAITQLMGAAVERMKCCFGAVVVPDHGLELTHESLVHIDIQAAGAFERSRPFFMNYIQRRKQPLIANKVAGGTNMPPFKLLVVPIQPHKDKLIGFIAFLKQAALPNFGRRQLFLARHIGHQIGSLLESQYDLATGLLTRSAFEQDVVRLLEPLPKERVHSLISFDIDRLHVINDTLGFDTGDEAIVRISDLLHAPALPDNAIACRLGGDNFAVFLPDHDAEQAALRAQEVIDLAGACMVGPADGRVALSLRAGVVRLYANEEGLSAPLVTAEMACKSARDHGGGRVEIYLDIDDSMMRRRHDVFEIANLRSALVEGRFTVFGQKIVSAADHAELHSIECLVRMVGEDGRIIPPGEFLPSAQRYQMLQAIDHWVISKTLRELKPHRAMLLDARVSIAINISGQSIQDEAFIEAIERWLLDSMIAPGLIHFEITETAAISNIARAERLIRKLRQHGCGFSLDDFGTGVNSLAYLKCLPVTGVKIDGSFTRDLLSNNRSDVVVQTIVQMAKSLDIECIAECVETLPVAKRLKDLGVGQIQGYVVHRPEPLQDLLESIKSDASQRLHQLYMAQ